MTLTLLQEKISVISNSPTNQDDYFELIKEIIRLKRTVPRSNAERTQLSQLLAKVYKCVDHEIVNNKNRPVNQIKFGTSGWRGIIGKDFTNHTVQIVTLGIIKMYEQLDHYDTLSADLGVNSFSEAKQRGVVVGHDNRFGGERFAKSVCNTLTHAGFTVYFGGESTTGALSAAILGLKAAFSINLTPSHNPLEYAGFKFNASDAGPASASLTQQISLNSNLLLQDNKTCDIAGNSALLQPCDTLSFWQNLVAANKQFHTIDPEQIMTKLQKSNDFILVVDPVHGASRTQIKTLLSGLRSDQVIYLRDEADVTFGGIAPEPSTKNMEMITDLLAQRRERLKLGVILDPDGDRIRFTDGVTEINMNYFGAMAYHFLHEKHGLSGMVAKSVATSNLANKLASDFNEEVFEPRVGFKEFKPVVNSALVCFEESDGITITHHTPEKDGYIGLFLALNMVSETNLPLGDYFREIQAEYGYFFPEKDSVSVSEQGEALLTKLSALKQYSKGKTLKVGGNNKTIAEAITIDGIKLVFEDQSWLLIRPSGTEPKVRFYVESRTEEGKNELFAAARQLLADIDLL